MIVLYYHTIYPENIPQFLIFCHTLSDDLNVCHAPGSHTEVKIDLIQGRCKITTVGLNGRMNHGSTDLHIMEQ